MLGLNLCISIYRRYISSGAPDGHLITSDGNDFKTSDGGYFIVA